jgi:recombination protein RecA
MRLRVAVARRIKSENNNMNSGLLCAQIEAKHPSAFAIYQRPQREYIRAGIPEIDSAIGGVPLRALTEICGSNLVSSGKTSLLISLLAQASRERFCALVDAGDAFDPASAQAAGAHLSKLLWVRCGKSKVKLPPLEQAFKVADILLQSGGFGLIAVDISTIAERVVRKVPLSSWFRFSRVIEKQVAALVFIEQEPHATSCAGLVLRMTSGSAGFSGNLLTKLDLKAEVVRDWEKKPIRPEYSRLSLPAQWA